MLLEQGYEMRFSFSLHSMNIYPVEGNIFLFHRRICIERSIEYKHKQKCIKNAHILLPNTNAITKKVTNQCTPIEIIVIPDDIFILNSFLFQKNHTAFIEFLQMLSLKSG